MVETYSGIDPTVLDRALQADFEWHFGQTGIGQRVGNKVVTPFDVVDTHRTELNRKAQRQYPQRTTDDLVSHIDALQDLCEGHGVQLHGAMRMAALWGARYGVSEHEAPSA